MVGGGQVPRAPRTLRHSTGEGIPELFFGERHGSQGSPVDVTTRDRMASEASSSRAERWEFVVAEGVAIRRRASRQWNSTACFSAGSGAFSRSGGGLVEADSRVGLGNGS